MLAAVHFFTFSSRFPRVTESIGSILRAEVHGWCGIVPTDSNQMEVTTMTPSGLRRDIQTLALIAFVGLSAVLFVACSSSAETPVPTPSAAELSRFRRQRPRVQLFGPNRPAAGLWAETRTSSLGS